MKIVAFMIIGIAVLWVFSIIFMVFPPRKINLLYGYRTPRSMKDTVSWKFANRYASKLMVICFSIVALVALGSYWLQYEIDIYLLASVIVSLVIVMAATEHQLKKIK